MCSNPLCSNRTRWQLIVETSGFVDWQKVRIQENSSDIPSGSMPRTLDVILRHEEVEKAKAGDRCVFTGTLIVIPDISRKPLGPKVSQAAGRGSLPPSGRRGASGGADGAGDIFATADANTYHLAFLACSVQSVSANRVCVCVCACVCVLYTYLYCNYQVLTCSLLLLLQ